MASRVRYGIAALIGPGDIKTQHIEDGAITTAKLANNAVTEQKIASGAVRFTELIDTFPTLTGKGNKLLKINAGETTIESLEIEATSSTNWHTFADTQRSIDTTGTDIKVKEFQVKNPGIYKLHAETYLYNPGSNPGYTYLKYSINNGAKTSISIGISNTWLTTEVDLPQVNRDDTIQIFLYFTNAASTLYIKNVRLGSIFQIKQNSQNVLLD